MKGKILITDSLFIFEEHEKALRDAGFEIERLDKPEATEDELVEHIKGKVGYILGGIESVTDRVIDAADSLKIIAFTGADARAFIPAYDKAIERGIVITTTPGANSYAVAEYTIAVILAMTRNLFELGRTGDKKFQTTRSLNELTIGIVGMGNIGSRVAVMLHGLGAKKLLYSNRTQKSEIEKITGAKYVDLDELLAQSDIISLHVSKEVGDGFIGKKELAKMKDGALLVNCGFADCVDHEALLPELLSGRLRAAQDDSADIGFNQLPLSVWYCSNASTAYNTVEANRVASDMATKSILATLSGVDKVH